MEKIRMNHGEQLIMMGCARMEIGRYNWKINGEQTQSNSEVDLNNDGWIDLWQ